MTVAQIDELVAQRVARGECGCGCKGSIPTPPPDGEPRQKYVSGSHRQRVYRKRLNARARAVGVEPRLSLHRLPGYVPTGARHGDAQIAGNRRQARRPSRPRPGVSVYLPSVDVAERLLEVLVDVDDPAVDELEARLRAAVERRRRAATFPAS